MSNSTRPKTQKKLRKQVSIAPDLVTAAQAMAAEDSRSFSGFLESLIRQAEAARAARQNPQPIAA